MIIPVLRYREGLKAIEWLCEAFGFEKHAVYADGETVMHAELALAGGMIMLGSAVETEFGRMMKQPDEIGGFVTQSIYVVVPDPDAVHDRAKASGAKIERALVDQDYGGRDFACRDLEGHLWSFGTYDPRRK